MKSPLTELLNLKKKNIIIIFLAVLGICLILISGEKTNQSEESKIGFNEEAYEETLEKRLKSIIEEIDGVGEVSVMITLEGSAVYSYATDVSQDSGKEGDSKRESTIVLSTKASSVKEAIVSGYALPKVKGAAVVCSSSLSSVVRAKVIGVVSAALGISSARICVTN